MHSILFDYILSGLLDRLKTVSSVAAIELALKVRESNHLLAYIMQ